MKNRGIRFYGWHSCLVGVVLLLYFCLDYSFHLPSKSFQVIVVSNLICFLLPPLLMVPGFNKAPENFTMRFLILTTIQLLAVLSLIAALVYLDFPDKKRIGFHLICLFCALLASQSTLLIRSNQP